MQHGAPSTAVSAHRARNDLLRALVACRSTAAGRVSTLTNESNAPIVRFIRTECDDAIEIDAGFSEMRRGHFIRRDFIKPAYEKFVPGTGKPGNPGLRPRIAQELRNFRREPGVPCSVLRIEKQEWWPAISLIQ